MQLLKPTSLSPVRVPAVLLVLGWSSISSVRLQLTGEPSPPSNLADSNVSVVLVGEKLMPEFAIAALAIRARARIAVEAVMVSLCTLAPLRSWNAGRGRVAAPGR